MIRVDLNDYKDRKKHREEVVNALNEFLSRPIEETLVRLCDALWAFDMIRDKKWLVRKRILKNTKVLSIFHLIKNVLLNENLSLEDRVDKISIPGFGRSSLTEILFSWNPNKYPILNKRAIEALNRLGIKVDDKIEYSDYIDLLERLADELEHVRKENSKVVNEDIPRFEFIDYILNGICEGKISVEEVAMARLLKKKIDEYTLNYAIGAIQGAIKMYFHWIEKGVPEDRAIDRAVNYAFGVIASSGVLNDKDKLEKFKYALSAISGLEDGILEVIESLK